MPTTVTAFEDFLRPQTNVQTLMASLTGIRGWYSYHLNARLNTFVFQECTQLVERPITQAPAFSLISRFKVCPFTNTRQLFHCNSCIGVNGISNDSSTNCMVKPSLISFFPSRQPFQRSPTSFASSSCEGGSAGEASPADTPPLRGLALKRSSYLGKFVSSIFYLFAVPFVCIACYRYIASTKINTNHVSGLNWLWGNISQLNMQVIQPVAMLTQLSAGWLSTCKFACLVVTKSKLDVFPSSNQGKASCPVFLPKCKDSRIIISAGWFERFNRFAFSLGSLAISSDPSTSPDRQISTSFQTALSTSHTPVLGWFYRQVWMV